MPIAAKSQKKVPGLKQTRKSARRRRKRSSKKLKASEVRTAAEERQRNGPAGGGETGHRRAAGQQQRPLRGRQKRHRSRGHPEAGNEARAAGRGPNRPAETQGPAPAEGRRTCWPKLGNCATISNRRAGDRTAAARLRPGDLARIPAMAVGRGAALSGGRGERSQGNCRRAGEIAPPTGGRCPARRRSRPIKPPIWRARIAAMRPLLPAGVDAAWSLAMAQFFAQRDNAPMAADAMAAAASSRSICRPEGRRPNLPPGSRKLDPALDRYSEVHWARQLSRLHGLDWSIVELALATRRLGEQVVIISPATLPWIRSRLAAADRLRLARRTPIDRCDRQRSAGHRRTAVPSGDRPLPRGGRRRGRCRWGRAIRNDLMNRLPYYLAWRQPCRLGAFGRCPAQRGSDRAVRSARRIGATLVHPARRPTWTKSINWLPSRPLWRIGSRRAFPMRRLRISPAPAPGAGSGWRIEMLLATPLFGAASRQRLLADATTADAKLAAGYRPAKIEAVLRAGSRRSRRSVARRSPTAPNWKRPQPAWRPAAAPYAATDARSRERRVRRIEASPRPVRPARSARRAKSAKKPLWQAAGNSAPLCKISIALVGASRIDRREPIRSERCRRNGRRDWRRCVLPSGCCGWPMCAISRPSNAESIDRAAGGGTIYDLLIWQEGRSEAAVADAARRRWSAG